MFNFKLYNAALEDANLTDKEFRMLCLFLNKSSMDKSDTIEMFNGFLMDKLNLCERHIRRLTNSLEKKGYFTKTITGTVKNRNANTYTLNCTEKCDKNVPPCNIKDEDKNVDIKCDKNVPPYKEHINNNKNIYNTCSNSTCREKDNIKEKSNKKEMEYRDNGSMGVSPSDERDESFCVFYNSLDDGDDWDESQMEEVNKNIKENEMNDNGMNEMNANGNGVKRNESITSTVVNETRPTSTESMKIYTATAAQTETEKKRESLLQNIESGKKFMYEASKTKDLNQWKAQMDYITIQFNNLKNITPTDAYNGVRKDFKRWWDATKPYFPKGWNEKAQQPQKKKLLTKIKERDQQVLQYWIDSTDDNKDEMISRLLSKWQDVYEPDTIAQIFEKSQINASCASETSDVDNYPIQHVKTQYKPQEEECGDFVNDSLRIYCINNPSVQVAN